MVMTLRSALLTACDDPISSHCTLLQPATIPVGIVEWQLIFLPLPRFVFTSWDELLALVNVWFAYFKPGFD
jgi:hypothetical protein